MENFVYYSEKFPPNGYSVFYAIEICYLRFIATFIKNKSYNLFLLHFKSMKYYYINTFLNAIYFSDVFRNTLWLFLKAKSTSW